LRYLTFQSFYFLFAAVVIGLSACAKPAENASTKPAPTPSSTSPAAASVQTVTIDSADGVKLAGSFYASTKANSPAVLLLHQWQSDRHSYDDFAKGLNEKGFNVLSIDGRGFGESITKGEGTTVKAGRTDADVKAMLGDVDAAVQFLAKQNSVDPSKIGVAGASYGSSLAIIYSADHSNVAAVALLSPGLDYFGNMPIEEPLKKYYGTGRPLFIAAAKDDPESDASVTKIIAEGLPQDYPAVLFRPEKGGHGTALLKVGLADELEKFFTTNLKK
jgi:dienelactone hydrolase